MAFNLNNLTCVSESLASPQVTVVPFGGSSTVFNAPNLFTYKSPVDNLAAIKADNYFLPNQINMGVGDFLMLSGTDANGLAIVLTSTSTGITVGTF